MLQKVYIQKFGGEFIGDYAYAAYEGFKFRDRLPVQFFEDIMEVPARKSCMVVGCVEDTIIYLNRLGVTIPPAMNVPEALMPLVGRKISVMKLEEFLSTDICPAFVKPVQLKQCTSGLIKSDRNKRLTLSDAPAGIDVMVSTPINIINEYRAFVHRGKFVGLKQYNKVDRQEDLLCFPESGYMMGCLEAMNESGTAPIGYTMDFAVKSDMTTEVIECNDGWSIGTYGLDGEIYIDILIDRWMELTKNL